MLLVTLTMIAAIIFLKKIISEDLVNIHIEEEVVLICWFMSKLLVTFASHESLNIYIELLMNEAVIAVSLQQNRLYLFTPRYTFHLKCVYELKYYLKCLRRISLLV